jgi:hypothetical protein
MSLFLSSAGQLATYWTRHVFIVASFLALLHGITYLGLAMIFIPAGVVRMMV